MPCSVLRTKCFQVKLRSSRNEEVYKLCSSIMTAKSESVLLKHVLGSITEGSSDVCWLCKQLEDLLRCSQLQPDEAIRALALEKAAAQRIALFGATSVLVIVIAFQTLMSLHPHHGLDVATFDSCVLSCRVDDERHLLRLW